MANIQKQIVAFDEDIRLVGQDNKELRERRDAVLDKLQARLNAKRGPQVLVPRFSFFHQGSYKMGTGIRPAEGDYDIDVGLQFNCTQEDYPDPRDLKQLVVDSLVGHTPLGTTMRNSCVTIRYQRDGERVYHVDLSIYVCDDPKLDNPSIFIAKGKPGSNPEDVRWEASDPKGLIQRVDTKFSGEDEDQFLRVIRLLKRWRSWAFKVEDNSTPTGIGLTVAALLWFSPAHRTDPVTRKQTLDDVEAMRGLVDRMLGAFTSVPSAGWPPKRRLVVTLPVAPHNDLFGKMSETQMQGLETKLTTLRDLLAKVQAEPDTAIACELMHKGFDEEFPVPERKETATKSAGTAISSSGTAA